MKCTNCGSLAIDYADNQAVCSQCGVVLEESQIVSEITFGETSGGGAVVQGSMISADQGRARISGPAGFRGGFVSESREYTISNARNSINKMAGALRVPSHVADRALRFFTLALDGGSAAANGEEPKNYVLGRKAEYTIASCLYVACRMDKTTHMLIDFADAIQVNVFILGRSYLKLVRVLNLKLPLIDPSIYISRFAALLDFGDETQRVASDASRLVARFKKDWLTEGRRPAGICGACLLLAARMNHFRRSISEVIQVVKIADITLRHRLEEFKKTPTGELSVQDFRNVWLEEEYNPPAYLRARAPNRPKKNKRGKTKKLKAGKRSKSEAVEGQDVDQQEADDADAEAEAEADAEAGGDDDGDGQGDGGDSAGEGSKRGASQRSAKQMAGKRQNGERHDEDDLDAGGADEEIPIDPALENLVDQATADEINTYLQEGIAKELDKTLEAQENARQQRARFGLVDGGQTGEEQIAGSDGQPALEPDPDIDEDALAAGGRENNVQVKLSQTQRLLPLGGLGMELDDVISGSIDNNGEGSSRQVHATAPSPSAPSGVKKHGSEPPNADDLGDLDEEELDRFILTPDEVRVKERVWMEFNKDWLETQLRKQLKMEHDQKHGIPIREPYKRKKPKAPRDASTAMHQSAAESAKMMFKQKSFSKKINYDALNSLFPGAKRVGEVGSKKGSKRKRGRRESSDESDSSNGSDSAARRGAKRKGKGKDRARAHPDSVDVGPHGSQPDYFPSDQDDEMEIIEEDASLPSSHPLMRRESRMGKKKARSGDVSATGGESTADAGTDLGTEFEDGDGDGDAEGEVDEFSRNMTQQIYRRPTEDNEYFVDDGAWD